MRDMERKGNFPEYRPSKQHPVVWVLGKPDSRWAVLRRIGDSMKNPLWFRSVTEEEHGDEHLLRFIGGRPYESLHTSGHAYVETIARLISLINPKIIIPMHTECPEDFTSIPEFAPYYDRVRVLWDGIGCHDLL